MAPLTAIWASAFALALASVVWMAVLILLRLWRERRARELARARATVIAAISDLLRDRYEPARALTPYLRRASLMSDAILEFQGLIRGADQEAVIEKLRGLGLVQSLSDRLQGGGKAGRLMSIEAIGVLGGPEAVAALRAAAQTSEPDVRHAAWLALAQCGAPPPLATLLADMDGAGVQPSKRVAELIRRVVGHDPRQAEAALKGAHRPQTRALLVDALGRSGDYATLPVLLEAVTDPDADVRSAAVRGLGRMQHPMTEAALRGALNDPEWPVQLAGAEAVGQSGFAELSGDLARLLGHPEWWVRFRAGEALARLGGSGIAALRAARSGAGDLAGDAAARALAEAGRA